MSQHIWKLGICILMVCFVSIIFRFGVRTILVEQLNMDNEFTKIVLKGTSLNNADALGARKNAVTVDWESLYPFDESMDGYQTPESDGGMLDKYTERIHEIEDKIKTYSKDFVAGYNQMVGLTAKYKELIGWNYISYAEYNGVMRMDEDYLVTISGQKEVDDEADAVIKLDEFCEENNIGFLYVQAPEKIGKADTELDGVNFSNQNADNMLKLLKEKNVAYLDLRDKIYEQDLDHHELFYKTDHHWKVGTGIWAAKEILEFCNAEYGWDAQTDRLLPSNFESETYENILLGSQGKKLTLYVAEPEDFTIYYPRYDTRLRYVIPDLNLDMEGDYSIIYDKERFKIDDIYASDVYGSCNYGGSPLIEIENKMDSDSHEILFVRDSFSDVVISPVALCEGKVDAIDMRGFNGSVRSYIEKNKPDLVILMYTTTHIGGKIEWDTHTDLFDFR